MCLRKATCIRGAGTEKRKGAEASRPEGAMDKYRYLRVWIIQEGLKILPTECFSFSFQKPIFPKHFGGRSISRKQRVLQCFISFVWNWMLGCSQSLSH